VRVPLLLNRLRKRRTYSPTANNPNSDQKATLAPGCLQGGATEPV
jgi:hypothetical protein